MLVNFSKQSSGNISLEVPSRENVVVEVKLGTTIATEVHPCSYMRSLFFMWSKGIVHICEIIML